MLMMFHQPEQQRSLAHADVCTSATRRLLFQELPFQTSVGISPLCQEIKVCSATSSPPGKLNLVTGYGVGPIEQDRKG